MNITSNRSTPGRAMIVCILTDWHATEESSDNLSNASEHKENGTVLIAEFAVSRFGIGTVPMYMLPCGSLSSNIEGGDRRSKIG